MPRLLLGACVSLFWLLALRDWIRAAAWRLVHFGGGGYYLCLVCAVTFRVTWLSFFFPFFSLFVLVLSSCLLAFFTFVLFCLVLSSLSVVFIFLVVLFLLVPPSFIVVLLLFRLLFGSEPV